jgi:large subunit ribosomal protein L28
MGRPSLILPEAHVFSVIRLPYIIGSVGVSLPDDAPRRKPPPIENQMARKDQLTGQGPVAGNHVSHAHNKAKRRFEVNLQKKRFYVPEEDRWVTLRVSTQTIKTINKKGISAVLAEARRNGVNL